MSMSAIAARAAALLLTSEKGRKGVGFLLVAIFAPVILIAAIPARLRRVGPITTIPLWKPLFMG